MYIYWIIKYRFLYYIRKYLPRFITVKKKSLHQQDWANCWIFSVLNNLYLNTWITCDPIEFKEYIKKYWFNPEVWNSFKISATILCKFLERYNIRAYYIDVLKDTKLFAELLKNWYSFVYSRDCHDNVLQDIKDNNEINETIRTKWYRHAVNICFINWKLTEFGSRWDYNIYNNFVYWDTDIFIKSVKAWAIYNEVLFLDFKQNV